MLAIEVVLAGSDPVPTFVFDEVDAGVGGASAIEIGRRLARLAATAQVIVVTHLAQVAAYATNHLVVEKGSDGTVTASNVRLVHAEDRTIEMARMHVGGSSHQPHVIGSVQLTLLKADVSTVIDALAADGLVIRWDPATADRLRRLDLLEEAGWAIADDGDPYELPER